MITIMRIIMKKTTKIPAAVAAAMSTEKRRKGKKC